jgi:hypothetical protein
VLVGLHKVFMTLGARQIPVHPDTVALYDRGCAARNAAILLLARGSDHRFMTTGA